MRWLLTMTILAGLLVLMFIDWRGPTAGTVNVIGSTSVQPFAEMLAQEFNKRNPKQVADVQGGGSTAGIQAVSNGVADIGMCSRSLKDGEHFEAVTIARDGLAIVVHVSNTLTHITRDQARRIFAGQVSNWKAIGGPDRPIRLITREEGSGTREAFQKLVMDKTRIAPSALTQESNGAVQELVKHDPCAVGYMSLGLVNKDLKALQVDNVAPTSENVINKRYPLVRPFLFVTRGEPSEKARLFIDYVLSADAQKMLESEGLVRAK